MKVPSLFLSALIVLSFSVQTQAQSARYARVVAQEANLRDSPSVNAELKLTIAEDTLVKVLDEKLPWYVVRVGNRVGWMHGDTLEFINADTRAPGQPSEQTVVPDYSPVTPTKRSDYPVTQSRTSAAPERYIRGPRGGCYYISNSGRKVYVDRSLCN